MIDSETFYQTLLEKDVGFFVGVPDSLLGSFCACIAQHSPQNQHLITANEGAAIGTAAGYYLATGKLPLVYMQNSGLGNAVNPLLSLVDPAVYSIPMLLLIGWRGEPGTRDEPQHMSQGEATMPLLEAMGIACHHLPTDTGDAVALLHDVTADAMEAGRPVALLVSKNTFTGHDLIPEPDEQCLSLSRERAIDVILEVIGPEFTVVSSAGMISRELYELREQHGQRHDTDFLTVGSMGHCSQIAMGVALANQNKKVICLDGDGSALMHMGSMAVTAQSGANNLIHVILNNGRHDSVGGQPTCGLDIDFPVIAKGCGYESALTVNNEADLNKIMGDALSLRGPVLIEVRVRPGNRDDLGRPGMSVQEQKQAFMRHLTE